MSENKERATRLLVNYFEAIAKKAGFKWEPDYTAEIALAVDDIVAAAVAEVQLKLEPMQLRIEALEATTVKDANRLSEHAKAVAEMRRELAGADDALERLAPLDPRD